MFGDLTKAPIRREGRAVLKGASLLEERLLGMKTNATSLAGFGADALRAQGAGVAQRGVEAKSLHDLAIAAPIGDTLEHRQCRAGVARRTGARFGDRIDGKIFFGERRRVGSA